MLTIYTIDVCIASQKPLTKNKSGESWQKQPSSPLRGSRVNQTPGAIGNSYAQGWPNGHMDAFASALHLTPSKRPAQLKSNYNTIKLPILPEEESKKKHAKSQEPARR
jgi:hypothetical protein